MVDGYNLPLVVDTTGGSGSCATTGCATDVNRRCPVELRAAGGAACKSACNAFGTPEYCCSGAYGSPDTCKPSEYSLVFKTACPRSYSYAYDDASSTFTCSAADYTITFCPNSHRHSLKVIDKSPGIVVATGDSSRTVLRYSFYFCDFFSLQLFVQFMIWTLLS
ncbi:Thaumatin-like protein 1 [Cardamine amara subsp. amara]|uniref:Thaumatin-like protein 1 n=1 Tax=Cardamine amara subsp. amara TaxID=228776 RepID=A0ABD1BDT7_CARAN